MILINLIRESNRRGYEITMNILWSECKRVNIVLESEKPPTRSAFSQARKKIKAEIIKMMFKKSAKEFKNYMVIIIYGKDLGYLR